MFPVISDGICSERSVKWESFSLRSKHLLVKISTLTSPLSCLSPSHPLFVYLARMVLWPDLSSHLPFCLLYTSAVFLSIQLFLFTLWFLFCEKEIASDNDHSRGVDDNDLWFKCNITVWKVKMAPDELNLPESFESFFHQFFSYLKVSDAQSAFVWSSSFVYV